MRWKTWHLVLAVLMSAALMAVGQFLVDCRARRVYWLDQAESAARSVEKQAKRVAQFETQGREAEARAVELLSSPDRSAYFHQRLEYQNQQLNFLRKAANSCRNGIDRGRRDEQEYARRATRPWSHPIPR